MSRSRWVGAARSTALRILRNWTRVLGGGGPSLWTSVNTGNALPPEALDFPRAYRWIAPIRWAVDMYADTIPALPLRFYTVNGQDVRTPVKRQRGNPSNIVELFATANVEDSGRDLMAQLVISRRTCGIAYMELDFLGTGRPQQLWMRPPLEVTPTKDGYLLREDITKPARFIPRDRMVVFRTNNAEIDRRGAGPLEALKLNYETKRDLERWLRTFYGVGGVVAGDYSSEYGLDDADRLALEKALSTNSTPERFWIARVLGKKAKYDRRGLTIQEMMLPEVDRLLLHNVCLAMKIPVSLAGLMDGSGLNSDVANTAKLQFFEQGIEPECDSIAKTIIEKMLARGWWGPNLECEFDFSNVDAYQVRRLKQAEMYVTITGGPVMMRGQAMDEMKIERPANDPTVDELLVPISMVTESGAQAAPPAPVPPRRWPRLHSRSERCDEPTPDRISRRSARSPTGSSGSHAAAARATDGARRPPAVLAPGVAGAQELEAPARAHRGREVRNVSGRDRDRIRARRGRAGPAAR